MPFTNSTFGCLAEPAVCIDTFCCPCFQVGRQCNALDGQKNSLSLMWCCASLCFAPVLIPCIRCKVSDKFQLDEAPILGCLWGCCCPLCTLCMTNRELNYRGVNPGGCCCASEDAPIGNDGKPCPPKQFGQQASNGNMV